MSKPDVLAVAKLHPFYQKALASLYTVHDRTHVTDPAAFAALAPRIVGVAGTGEASVPRSLLAQVRNAKVVSVFGVGYDGVDVPAAIEHGIPVTHTPDVLTDDVADLAMGLVLSVGRNIPQADQFVRAGQWPGGPMALGRKVSGARMGIVGLGRIGKAIARRASGFGMSIAYTARTEKADSGFKFFRTAADLAANVGNEPNVPGVLWGMPNVVLTPHMASATTETRQAMADLAFANMQAGISGQPLRTPVPECAAMLQK